MALGWIINDGDKLLLHDGGTYGFQSLLLVDRANELAVVVLTNSLLFNEQMTGIDTRPNLAGFEILKYLRESN